MMKKVLYTTLFIAIIGLLAHTTYTLNPCSEVSSAKVSPQVTHFEWGKVIVGATQFKDCRLWPNHQEEWNWNKTEPKTRHVPGIQISDLSDFINDVDEVVLSEGVDGVLQTKDETLKYLQKAGKIVHKARTPEAIKIYNERAAKGVRVGALLHSTC